MTEYTKIVYNACYGGFSISEAAIRRYAKIKGITLYPEEAEYGFTTFWTIPPEEREGKYLKGEEFYSASFDDRAASNKFWSENTISERDIDRDDPVLVQVVEELGEDANGRCAQLRIAELPNGTLYRIDEYDGFESVETKDSYEWKVA